MLAKLRQRWGVNTLRLVLILCTFAIGGSLCGYAARQIMLQVDIEAGIGWWLLYIVIVTLLWPVAVLLVSVFFGQFSFFRTYLWRLAQKMGIVRKDPKSPERPKASDPM